MRKLLTKALAVMLAACILPVPEATMLAYGDTGATRYVSDGDVMPGGYVSPDFDEENFQTATASDAIKTPGYKGNPYKSKRMKSIYETDMVLTENEVENGVELPLNDGAILERLSQGDMLFNNYRDGVEYPEIDPSLINSQAVSTGYLDEFNEVNKNSERRISSVYDHKTKRRLRNVIMGGTDLVKYLADQMTFGISPIYISPDYSSNEIYESINEANWQNQMILEEDNMNRQLDEQLDSNGRLLYYVLKITYEIPDPEERKKLQIEMIDKAEEIIDNVGLYTNGHYLEELYGINDYIIENGSYNHNVKKAQHIMQRKAYGILIEGNGVCSSYARAFQLVARKAGFICVVDGGQALVKDEDTGEIKPGEHAWNMVCTQWEGDNYKRWMMVDPTWNDDDNVYRQPRNTYLMIPKSASSRNRVSDGLSFSTRGKFSYINQDLFNFEYDYLRYSDHSAQNSTEFIDDLCEYIRRGYVHSFFRCEWELKSSTMNYVCDEVYRRTHVSLSMSTEGYDAYIVDISFRNDNPAHPVRETTKGLDELKEVNGQYVESTLEYPGYMHGTKPAPEPEITEEERKADEEEARRIKEEEQRKQEEEQKKQNQGGGGGSRRGGGGSGGGGGSRKGRSSGDGGGSSSGAAKKQNNMNTGNKSAGWKQDVHGWWYQNADGSYPHNTWIKINGSWYLFNASGYMATGWQKADGSCYYMSSSGVMTTDWASDGGKWYYMNSSGAMTANAWVQSGGKWYYLGSDGAMLRNTKTPDGYMVKADGSL